MRSKGSWGSKGVNWDLGVKGPVGSRVVNLRGGGCRSTGGQWGSIYRLGERLSEMLNKSFDERECLDYILHDRVEYDWTIF